MNGVDYLDANRKENNMRITKEERMRIAQRKLQKSIDDAYAGEFICTASESVRDRLMKEYDCIRWEDAIYLGSLPKEERIPMYNLYKV